MLGLKKKVGVEVSPGAADANEEARRARNGVRPIGPAEDLARRELATLAHGTGYIEPDDLAKGFAPSVPKFDEALEDEVDPQRLVPREAVEGHVALGDPGDDRPLPRRRRDRRGPEPPELGAHAHRRGGARRRDRAPRPVALDAGGVDPGLDDPGDARGLSADAREDDGAVAVDGRGRREGGPDVAARRPTRPSSGEPRSGSRRRSRASSSGASTTSRRACAPASSTYFPVWFAGSGGSGAGGSSAFGEGGGGLFSSSGVPDIGGMMASLSTIGNSPPRRVGRRRWRVRRRRLGRRRRRLGRRVLSGAQPLGGRSFGAPPRGGRRRRGRCGARSRRG